MMNYLKDKKILLLGGSGFVGKSNCEEVVRTWFQSCGYFKATKQSKSFKTFRRTWAIGDCLQIFLKKVF